MRSITLPPGIGDGLWVIMKLINSGEKFDFRLPDGIPQRGKQLYDLLPQITNSCEYHPNLSYKKIERNSAHHYDNRFSSITQKEFYLSANGWLESGKRIDGFLPDLPTTYQFDYATTEEEKARARIFERAKYISIYCSAYGNARHWNGWTEVEWMDLIKRIHNLDKGYKFVVFGMDYDMSLSEIIINQMNDMWIDNVPIIGQSLGYVIEVMKRLHYGFYFPSGLPIISESLANKGCVMFYPSGRQQAHVARIATTWAEPERISSGTFKECLFCEPEKIFNWCVQNGKL